MTAQFRALLDEIDSWLAASDAQADSSLLRDQLIQWQITLTTVHEEWLRLLQASQAAVDAFLLRPSSQARPGEKRSASGRPSGQKLYQQLAEAMAELEQVLVQLKAGTE
jgi:hypothetical protein